MDRKTLNQIMNELQLVGVRELRFISKNLALDQLNRKIVFYRRFGKITFRIQSS